MAVANMAKGIAIIAVFAAVGVTIFGCNPPKPDNPKLVVYTALDDIFSQPILDDFAAETGIEVLSKTDTESTKTVGLAEAIIAEQARPRCDLFWNNEVLHTLRLAKQGLLAPVAIPEAANYPAAYRSTSGTWVGFAARARVLIVNTKLLEESERPRSIEALVDEKWRDKCAIAKPLFGTTATHAACLFAAWGDERAKQFFGQVADNAKILSGNRDVARRVAAGQLLFGLTDTDDAMVEIDAGSPVEIIYPDQGDDQPGTLFIPNTLCAIKGSPNPENAAKLMAFLLKAETEAKLVEGPSAQIPLHAESTAKARVETPETVRAMEVDFEAAAVKWNTAYEFLRDEFMAAN